MVIEGMIDYVQYPKIFKKKMEWAVLHIKTDKGRVKACGEIIPCKRGDFFLFEGDIKKNKYGETFYFTRFQRSQNGEAGASAYLAHLFGPKTAQKIVQSFQTATEALQIFKEDPQQITQIKGIAAKTLNKALMKHQKHQVVEVLFTALKPYGVSMQMALKIYKKYGDDALNALKENPYRLIYDFDGFSFDVAEWIADYFQFSPLHQFRIQAGIFCAMKQAMQRGHAFLPAGDLLRQSIRILSKKAPISDSVVLENIAALVNEKRLIQEGEAIYLPALYQYEKGISDTLKRMVKKRNLSRIEVDDFLKKYESTHGIRIARKQKEAVFQSLLYSFSIITGPPGSGKTTIINAILEYLMNKKPDLRIGLAAPTGKAAKRMKESTGHPAFTVHKLLQYNPHEKTFGYDSYHPLPYDIIVIDEFSMMDLQLTYHLVSAVGSQTTLIFVGDHEQLPSVGPGQVLKDLIESSQFPVTVLNEIFRQKPGSTLLERAVQISKGRIPSLADAADFHFLEHDDLITLQEMMLEKYFEAVRKYGLDEVMILSPMRKTPLGVTDLNRFIQMEMNPPKPYNKEVRFGKHIFREGDKVIQTKTNDELGLINGEIGYIKQYIPEDPVMGREEKIVVEFDKEKREYTRDQFDELELAYAITIHKAQGCEWKAVFVPVCEEHAFMLQKNLLYTAQTRAKEELYLFGSKKVYIQGLSMVRETQRNSKLKDRIIGTR